MKHIPSKPATIPAGLVYDELALLCWFADYAEPAQLNEFTLTVANDDPIPTRVEWNDRSVSAVLRTYELCTWDGEKGFEGGFAGTYTVYRSVE
jgi:hypothetical protein